MKYIAVLITVFNRKEKTLLCLKNLFSQTLPDGYTIDVYLTDDGCTDGTPEAVAALYPQVTIIHADGNLYWNRGMYTAWKKAAETKDYDFYLWLNDDTFVYNDMVSALLHLSEDKDNGCIIVGPTQSTDHTGGTYGGRLKDGSIPKPTGMSVEVKTMNGNIVLIPRSVFFLLGNLDYYFTHSKGDFDYGLRAAKAGIRIYQAGKYLGECDAHAALDKWCNPEVPFLERWKMLHRPNGMPPKETFHLERRHNSMLMAVFHFCTIYIRCIFPKFWVKNKK